MNVLRHILHCKTSIFTQQFNTSTVCSLSCIAQISTLDDVMSFTTPGCHKCKSSPTSSASVRCEQQTSCLNFSVGLLVNFTTRGNVNYSWLRREKKKKWGSQDLDAFREQETERDRERERKFCLRDCVWLVPFLFFCLMFFSSQVSCHLARVCQQSTCHYWSPVL